MQVCQRSPPGWAQLRKQASAAGAPPRPQAFQAQCHERRDRRSPWGAPQRQRPAVQVLLGQRKLLRGRLRRRLREAERGLVGEELHRARRVPVRRGPHHQPAQLHGCARRRQRPSACCQRLKTRMAARALTAPRRRTLVERDVDEQLLVRVALQPQFVVLAVPLRRSRVTPGYRRRTAQRGPRRSPASAHLRRRAWAARSGTPGRARRCSPAAPRRRTRSSRAAQITAWAPGSRSAQQLKCRSGNLVCVRPDGTRQTAS